MPLLPYALTRPVLFGLDPEAAHELTMGSLQRLQNTPAQCLWQQARVQDPVQLLGLRWPNRVGLAAGLDKNGLCIDGLGALGFGCIEVGTVTPQAQPGNAKPRMFRLPQARALINRLGFNNQGLAAFVSNVRRAHSFRAQGGVLGLNIGKNASTPIERALDDYLLGLDGVYAHADYVTVNISSPNTQNLRSLQSDAALDGHFSVKFPRSATNEPRRVDYRVSFTPSVHGQKLVIRVLDTRDAPVKLTLLPMLTAPRSMSVSNAPVRLASPHCAAAPVSEPTQVLIST